MTTLEFVNVSMPVAELGKENALPSLEGHMNLQQKQHSSLGEYEGLFLKYGFERTAFPYRMQDGYSNRLQPTQVKKAILENEYLKAAFLPEYGGRLWSLYDKQIGRELLYSPESIRFGNLAVRNAWFAGGVEWNCGVVGHHPYTCEPLFCAALEREDGAPVFRMYQYERIRGVVYQMDFFLDEEQPLLYARMRISNPTDEIIPMYWWSNMAVPSRENGRVIVEADAAYTSTIKEVFMVPVPMREGKDITYNKNATYSVDYFWKVPREAPKYVTYVDENGGGLLQSSTARLNGRKLFVWGDSPGGEKWQAFLAPEGKGGKYVEIQAGLAPTQYECLPMPPNTTWEWLESYGAISANPKKVQGQWQEARKEVRTYLHKRASSEKLERILRDTRTMARTQGRLLMEAEGWGALENSRRAKQGLPPMTAHLDFGSLKEAQEPWASLLDTGSMGIHHPLEVPMSWMKQPEWFRMLACATHTADKDNWYTWLQLGMAALATEKSDLAKQAMRRSHELQANPWALYGLSVLLERDGDGKAAAGARLEAARMIPRDASLAKATIELLIRERLLEQTEAYYQSLPKALQEMNRIRLSRATAMAEQGKWLEAQAVLADEDFSLVDLREGENTLWETWEAIQHGRIAAGLERQELPAHLDFRMYVEQ